MPLFRPWPGSSPSAHYAEPYHDFGGRQRRYEEPVPRSLAPHWLSHQDRDQLNTNQLYFVAICYIVYFWYPIYDPSIKNLKDHVILATQRQEL